MFALQHDHDYVGAKSGRQSTKMIWECLVGKGFVLIVSLTTSKIGSPLSSPLLWRRQFLKLGSCTEQKIKTSGETVAFACLSL